jgi:tRNA A-37 threonylcarbamoyl transferase component Bud32
MNEQATCPECGKPLPPGSPHGLCPACLMAQGMASRTFDSLGGDVPPSAPPPSPEEIADKFPQYEIVECLGRGGMGVVYKARQKSLDRWVAIKVLAPERVREERFATHFEREAKTLAKMSHSNIVTVFDHGKTDGLFYIVMEFIDGVNLRDLLKEGKMAPEQALAIVPPICEALEYAHDKGVVHRDIKPENILLDRDGRVKIADFGIASLVGASGEKCGTPPYMAPEQEKGVVDRRGDIYALGAVLYEMLTGERPTRDLVAPSKRVEVDVKIDEMVLRALEKEPERRYQTAGEFRTMVQTITTPPQTASTSATGSPSSTNAKTSNTGWKVLKVFSWIGIVAGIVGILALIFSVMVVPRWEAGWADEGRQLPVYQILLVNISHFCLHLWPVLVFLLSILGISSLVGLVVAQKRLRRPADPTSKGGFIRRWWWLGLIMLILSPFLGLAVGLGWSQTAKEQRIEATATIQIQTVGEGVSDLIFPLAATEFPDEATLLSISEELDLPQRWGTSPSETTHRIQRMIDLEHLPNTMLMQIRVRDYAVNVPDGVKEAKDICDALVREAVVRIPGAQLVQGVEEAIQHRYLRVRIISLIVCALLGVLISPVLALLAMWLAHSFSAGTGDEGTSLVFSNLALGLAFLSGLIPTLFYWLRPLHGDWLTDSTVELMLWVTLGVAILALLSGWFTRRIARGRTAMIIGGISLTIWLLMFVAGELSSAKTQDYSEEIASHAPVEFLGQSNDLGRIRQSWRIEPKRPVIVTCGWYALEGERVVAHQAMGNALEPGTAPIELALEYVMDAGQLKLAVGSGGAVWRGTRAAPGSGFRSRPSRDPEPLTADRYTELWKGECFETEPDGSGERILRTYVFAARLIGPDEDPVQTPFEGDVQSGRFGEVPIKGGEPNDKRDESGTSNWTGTYRGRFNDQDEVWEIVRHGSDYHWLESPGGETGDFNRLKEKDGGLWAEDAAERFRFSQEPNGIRFEMWRKQTGEKVVDAVLERAELDENFQESVPVLDFRVAPKEADLESSELASCRESLKAGKIGFWWRDARTAGIAGRMPNHAWLPVSESLEVPGNLVTGKHDGRRYLLVSDKPAEKMVSGDGDDDWGLAKVEATNQKGDVLIRFDEKGGKKFKALTEANMYRALAVVLDDEVASVPVIRNVMEREVVLGGTRDKKKAADLADRLMRLVKPAGSLELRLEKARAEKLGFTIEALQARILASGIIPQTVKMSIAVEPDGLTIMIPNSSDVDIWALTNASLHNDEGKEVKVGDLFHIILKKENDDNP